jgi:hypothetical protein
MNKGRYYNFAESFSFTIDFKTHFNFIFQLHPKLTTYTDLAAFFRYLSIVLTYLLFMQVLLFIFE